MKIAYVPGVFDLLHEGHLNLLARARELADVVVVGVVSDYGTSLYKRLPVQNEQTRLAVIRSLRCVDFAVIQLTTDPTRELLVVQPHMLIHGDDWEKLREGHPTLVQRGIEFVKVPYTPGISTGQLIEKILERARS